jgi:hypothetical protein
LVLLLVVFVRDVLLSCTGCTASGLALQHFGGKTTSRTVICCVWHLLTVLLPPCPVLSCPDSCRVFSSGLFSKTVDWICEDYMRVEDNGKVIITQQWSKNLLDGSVQGQYLVGDRTGDHPPPRGHHKHH